MRTTVDLPDDLLTLTDRVSMAHSLEVRVPYLDHELLEFVARMPARLKVRGFRKKWLFRKAVAPPPQPDEPEATPGRRTIPFTLVGANARTPKNDRDGVLARQKEAERPPAWPGPHPDQG